jgi:Leucine-rich repeat (LRR) protein
MTQPLESYPLASTQGIIERPCTPAAVSHAADADPAAARQATSECSLASTRLPRELAGDTHAPTPAPPRHLKRPLQPGSQLAPLAALPPELLGAIITKSDTATQSAFRQVAHLGQELTDVYGPGNLATAISEYFLQSDGAAPATMSQHIADMHLARLRSFTIAEHHLATPQKLQELFARCPNIQQINALNLSVTWDELDCLGLDRLSVLTTLSLNISDVKAYAPSPTLHRVFSRLTGLTLVLSGPASGASLLALPMHALKSLQNLTLKVDTVLCAGHVKVIKLPRPEILSAFCLDATAGIEANARVDLVQFLAGAPLRGLCLLNCPIDCHDMLAFSKADRNALRRLKITGSDLQVGGLSALSRMHAPRLRTLTLERGSPINAEAAGALRLWKFANLETLNLTHTHLSVGACAALSTRPPGKVRKLVLENCDLNGDCLRALRLETWPQLRDLNLATNASIRTSVEARGVVPYWGTLRRLRMLDVSDCGLQFEDMATIPWADINTLRLLYLSGNPLTALSLRSIFGAPLPSLHTVDFSDCGFGTHTEMHAVPADKRLHFWRRAAPNLKSLRLSNNNLTLPQMAGLNLGTISKLRALDLSGNQIGPHALSAFDGLHLPHLAHLDLSNALAPQRLPAADLPEPVVRVSMPRLESLQLSYAPATALQQNEARPLPLNVALYAAANGNVPAFAQGAANAAICRIGTSTIFNCGRLTALGLSLLPDLKPARFNVRAFPHLRRLTFDGHQDITLPAVAAWIKRAPQLRFVGSGMAAEGFLLRPQQPDVFFHSLAA